MDQGKDPHSSTRGVTRPGRRLVTGLAVVAVVTSAGIGASATLAPAGAATRAPTPAPAPSTPTTTAVTVVSPTTTVTTTTRPKSVTTATTTTTTGPGSVTTTTVTSVAPTSTTVPARTTPTTAPATSTSTTAATSTTTTTTSVPSTSATVPPTTVPPTTVPPTTPPPTTAPAAAAFDPTCNQPATPGLQTYLDSLPAGSTFTSSTTACYLVPLGIRLMHPITIVGGTFYDPTDTRTPGTVYNSLKPIILIQDTSNVTVTGVTVLGGNASGGFHNRLVGQAGVKVISSANVTLNGILAKNTYGDGLELVSDRATNPVSGLNVEGYTTVNAGRQGITVAEVYGAVLDHVTITNPADAGVDFESDLVGIGSANVTFTNCADQRGFRFNEYLGGPVTVANCSEFHHVSLLSPSDTAPISFVGGTLACHRQNEWACIDQTGGNLSFTGVNITRNPGTWRVTELAWNVHTAGHLAFVNSPIEVAIGLVSADSTMVRR